MRGALRRVAFVGELSLAVNEALRAVGFRADRIDGTSIVVFNIEGELYAIEDVATASASARLLACRPSEVPGAAPAHQPWSPVPNCRSIELLSLYTLPALDSSRARRTSPTGSLPGQPLSLTAMRTSTS